MKILKPSLIIKRKSIDKRPKDIKDINYYLKLNKRKYPEYKIMIIKSEIIHFLIRRIYPTFRKYIPYPIKEIIKKVI